MSIVDVAALVVHQVFAAVWVGSVVFVVLTTVPRAKAGTLSPSTADGAIATLQRVARTSAVLVLLSGLWMLYSITWDGTVAVDSLYRSSRGQLVLAMVVLWLFLMATVEIGAARFRRGRAGDKLREPARRAEPWLRVAAGFAVLVTGVGGLLAAGVGT